jgi:hypothetical protein
MATEHSLAPTEVEERTLYDVLTLAWGAMQREERREKAAWRRTSAMLSAFSMDGTPPHEIIPEVWDVEGMVMDADRLRYIYEQRQRERD